MAEQDASAPTYNSRYDEGRRCANGGDYANARALFESLLSERPKEPSALASLAWVYMVLGLYDDAAGAAERCLQIEPASDLALTVLASVRVYQGLWPDSAELAASVLSRQPKNAEAHWSLGRAYFGLNRYKEALDEFDFLLAELPASEPAFDYKIQTLERLGRYSDALAVYRAWWNPLPEDLEHLGRVVELLRGVARSVSLPQSYLKDPTAWPRMSNMARARQWIEVFAKMALSKGSVTKCWKEILGYTARAYNLAPDDPEVVHMHALALWILGRWQQAIDVCEQYLQTHPPTAKLLTVLGSGNLLLGRRAEGLALLLRSYEIDPDPVMTNSMLSRAYFATGQFGKGFRQMFRERPSRPT